MNRVLQYFRTFKEYPAAFWVMCSHMLLFMFSIYMIVPELNDYLTDLGQPEYKWMIFGLWTIAAAVVRPLSGKIADNISRKSVMYLGVLISILCFFLYPLFATVTGFLILRFFHGFSTGFQPTGSSALIADIIPKGKRGQAMGFFGVMLTIGMTLGQGFASTVKSYFDMNGLFYSGAILGAASFILLFFIKEDRNLVTKNAEEQGYVTLRQKIIPKWKEVIGLEVFQPAFMMFLTASMAGFYFLLVPDLSAHLGYSNKGYFWVIYAGFTILTRLLTGRLIDLYGSRNNLYVCCALLIAASIVTGTASTSLQFEIGAALYGLGSGMGAPAIYTWTADISNPLYKGRGMATMFIALEVGILFGNFLGQTLYQNNPLNFPLAFGAGGILCLIGLIFLILTRKRDNHSLQTI